MNRNDSGGEIQGLDEIWVLITPQASEKQLEVMAKVRLKRKVRSLEGFNVLGMPSLRGGLSNSNGACIKLSLV